MSKYKVSNEEIRHMTMAYAIQMWCKREALEIEDSVPIYLSHIRNRFSTPLWGKRIEANFKDLADSHPHFYIINDATSPINGVLFYYPLETSI